MGEWASGEWALAGGERRTELVRMYRIYRILRMVAVSEALGVGVWVGWRGKANGV
jgi:hypothetical protein